MPTLLDQIVEVLDEVDSVADALQASGCAMTPEVVVAVARVIKATDRMSVTHSLFPPRSPDVERLYRETRLDVGDMLRALRNELKAYIARARGELAA